MKSLILLSFLCASCLSFADGLGVNMGEKQCTRSIPTPVRNYVHVKKSNPVKKQESVTTIDKTLKL